MNPWSHAEEQTERELFARRARALDAEDVPSLASVLKVADAERVQRGARGRSVVAFALAAACVASVWARLPSLRTGVEIVADADAGGAPRVTPSIGASTDVCTPDDEATCSAANTYASVEPPACVAQPASFSAYVPERAPLSCENEESCSIAGP